MRNEKGPLALARAAKIAAQSNIRISRQVERAQMREALKDPSRWHIRNPL